MKFRLLSHISVCTSAKCGRVLAGEMVERKEEVPYIPITIKENDINAGALLVLEQIRPQWKRNEIEFKLLTDGITNKLVGCRHKDARVAETVLVRIYGNKTDLLIDRKAETRNILLLGKLGLAPSLYATFNNGLAYQFVPGCTLTEQTVKQPEISKLVASRMAKLHQVQLPDSVNPEPFIWPKIQQFLDLVPEVFSDSSKNAKFQRMQLTKDKLQNELHYLQKSLTNCDSPVVFCHNDLLLGNVIYTEENGSVTFIDYEYAAPNYQAFDIANHFLEFAGIENVDFGKYPDKDFQMKWFQVYLEEFQKGFSESDLERLYKNVNKFVLVSHLFWAIWALIQTEHSYIDFDFLGYADTRFKEYFLKKKELVSANELP